MGGGDVPIARPTMNALELGAVPQTTDWVCVSMHDSQRGETSYPDFEQEYGEEKNPFWRVEGIDATINELKGAGSE